MVDTAKLETEAKAVVAETESVISGLLGAVNQRWPKFVTTWQCWTLRKKIIGGALIVIAGCLAWHFSVDVGRLFLGGYRSAYAYGHGNVVTRGDIQSADTTTLANAKAMFATRTQFNDLEAKVHQVEVEQSAIEKRLADQPAQITTGSIEMKKPHPKKPARKPASSSSWFNLP